MKVEIFTAHGEDNLQEMVNKFLEIIDLVDIKFAQSDELGYSAMIIYKT